MNREDLMGGRWRCSGCGEVATPTEALDAAWRWNGQRWQHCDGYPIGHVDAERVVDWESFGRAILGLCGPELHGDLDAGDVQDLGVRHGVLRIHHPIKPCQADPDLCYCACYHLAGEWEKGEVECYRIVEQEGDS